MMSQMQCLARLVMPPSMVIQISRKVDVPFADSDFVTLVTGSEISQPGNKLNLVFQPVLRTPFPQNNVEGDFPQPAFFLLLVSAYSGQHCFGGKGANILTQKNQVKFVAGWIHF